MKVLLVTSWDVPCGIFEHSAYLKEAVEKADPSIVITPSSGALDPAVGLPATREYDAVILNYHRALHSRWTPEVVKLLKGLRPIVTIFHDTFGENEPDDLQVQLCDLSDAFIVHEPVIGLPKATYWRMGVPEKELGVGMQCKYYNQRPIVGTLGFAFPWKCWVELAEAAEDAGWGLNIITPAIDAEYRANILRANPWTTFYEGLDRQLALMTLGECDATAFTFVCANSGQSASILQGIGARKPVIAFSTCRQFRALYQDRQGRHAIHWCETFADVSRELQTILLERFDAPTAHLAHHESWRHLGAKFADLLKGLVP